MKQFEISAVTTPNCQRTEQKDVRHFVKLGRVR